MLTRLYPMVQFKKDTWEIDEFDCASIFLLIGSERALLIDSGFGIGDLRGAVEMVTDKPITLVISHSHGDHCGSAYQISLHSSPDTIPNDKKNPVPVEMGCWQTGPTFQ